MRSNLFRAVLALAAVLVVTAPVAAQSVVRGKVVDAGGKPVEGATVLIEATEANRKAETKTNRNGEFLQVGLASGRYTVTVTKDKLKAVQPANVSQGTPVELSFQLSPTSGMTAEQIKAQQEMQALAAGAVEAMRRREAVIGQEVALHIHDNEAGRARVQPALVGKVERARRDHLCASL